MTLCPTAEVAYAQEAPYVVIKENVWLLSIDNAQPLFLMPKTYYARIDTMDESYYYVTFNGVKGKVERASVSTVGYSGEVKSTMQEVLIQPKYHIFTEIKLNTSMSKGQEVAVPVTASLIFIGQYPAEEMYYYVKYNEVCGYIKAEFTTNPNIIIAEFKPETSAENTATQPKATQKNKELIKILVITGLCVVFVVLLIVIFKPIKGKKNRYYYEE